MSHLTPFLADETGAVTVDWVVLTAALVGLGLAVVGAISSGIETASGDICGTMSGNIMDATNANGFYDPSALTQGNC